MIRRKAKLMVTAGILAFTIICFIGYSVFYPMLTAWEGDITIVSKHIDYTGKQGAYVVLANEGLFEVDRMWYMWSTDSNPDLIYGMIQPGYTYHVKTYGIRFEPIVYWYPLIYYATPAAEIK